jgi:inositol-pentakisphosphate 2-kinase
MECTIKISGKNYDLQYLAEGAANVVYKLRPSHKDLLRLRKTQSSVRYSEIVHSFETVMAPFFPNDALIHPILFKLPDVEVLIPRLNKALLAREASGGRPDQRCGVYLATNEEHGIFVQDMTPRHEKERFIEFKPKWLIQSPSAPAKAKRCRTCALREMRRTGNALGGRGDGDFCPLDLLSTENDVLEDVLRSLAGDDWRIVEAIFKNKVQPLLIRLRTLQIEHHRVGLADLDSQHVSLPSDIRADGSQESLATSEFFDTLIGMTVRDCCSL